MGHIYPYGSEIEAERNPSGHPRFYSFVIEVDGFAVKANIYWYGDLGEWAWESFTREPIDVRGYDDPIALVRDVSGFSSPIVDGPYDWDNELIEYGENISGPLIDWARDQGYDINN